MKTINITLKIEDEELNNFDYWLRQHLEVVSIKVIPNTEELYETDKTFKQLVKGVKNAINLRDNYINENN